MIYDDFEGINKYCDGDRAHIVAVVGGGGKSGYIRDMSKFLTDAGRRVCVTTTTHIFMPKLEATEIYSFNGRRIFCAKGVNACYIAAISDEGRKLCYPGDEVFEELKSRFDCILVEADGSRHLPCKVPRLETEPVIPRDTDRIVIIAGLHAIGKRLDEVCHRYELQSKYQEDTIVTEDILKDIVNREYFIPLGELYAGIPISVYYSYRKPAFIVMASGFGRRFGANKLLAEYEGRELYKHFLFELTETCKLFKKELNMDSEIILVTRYDEIFEDEEIRRLESEGKLRLCYNAEYEEGISGSVREGARLAHSIGCTEYIYCAADMPLLTAEDMFEYTREYIYSGQHFAVMDDGSRISNPGSISSAYFRETMEIHGDRGGMQVIKRYPEDIYHHPIAEYKLKDIDTREDLN